MDQLKEYHLEQHLDKEEPVPEHHLEEQPHHLEELLHHLEEQPHHHNKLSLNQFLAEELHMKQPLQLHHHHNKLFLNNHLV